MREERSLCIDIDNVLPTSPTISNADNTPSCSGPRIHCRAYFTFVSLDHHGIKCKVPKVIPETEAERDNFILAKERRQLRFKKKEQLETMLFQIAEKGGDDSSIRGRALTENPEGGEGISSQMSVKPKVWTGNRKRLSIMLRENLNLGAVLPPAEELIVTRSMGGEELRGSEKLDDNT